MHLVTAAGFLQGQHVSRLFVHDIWCITVIRISSSGQPYEPCGKFFMKKDLHGLVLTFFCLSLSHHRLEPLFAVC